eukprot:6264316-Lingulodinium_polyedra.AAC.1
MVTHLPAQIQHKRARSRASRAPTPIVSLTPLRATLQVSRRRPDFARRTAAGQPETPAGATRAGRGD